MKVCILTTSFPAYKCHFQSPFIYELAKSLSEKGVSVDVICPYYEESKSHEEKWGKIKIHRFKYWFTRKGQKLTSGGGIPSNIKKSLIAKIQFPFFLLAFYLKAKEYAKESDILHAQWSLSAFVGSRLKKKHKKILVLTERGAGANMAMKNKITKKLLLNVLNNCDFIAANNQSQIDLFRRLGIPKNKTLAVSNGINIAQFKPRNQKNIKEKLRLPKDKKIILFVGWLIERKGCKYLIRSIKEVAKKHPGVLLLIIGNGILEKKLKELAANIGATDNIRFLGAKKPQEIPYYMNAADIFVLPSFSEGRPNVVGEAMASALAVIATDVNGTSEFINNKKDGFLIPPKDSRSITHNLLRLLENKRLMTKIGKSARKSIIKKGWTWDSCASNYMNIYENLKRNK